jgi:L-lactate dehydrogenase
VAVQSVHAWIAGEHGDSEFPLWSATVGSVPLEQFSLGGRPPLDQEAKDRIAIEVITAAERIIRGKGATNYAIGLAASRVIEAVVRDESRVLSVTSLLDGHFGLKEVCLSLPAVVNRSRVEGVLDIPMSVPETEALGLSGDAVHSVATSLGL